MSLTKLYPPLIEPSIPTFTTIINIPFQHNALVGFDDFIGYQVQIKELNGKVIYTGYIEQDKNKNIIKIDTESFKDKLTTTINWYKISIAYVDTNQEVGYFSSAAVGKYLGEFNQEDFTLSLEKNIINNQETYKGIYIHKNDPTEKEFSYQFILYDAKEQVLADTGILLHNTQSVNDEADVSYDIFVCDYKLDQQYNQYGFQMNYMLVYKVKTINGYELSTSILINSNYSEMENEKIPFLIQAQLNREKGSVQVKLFNNENCNITNSITGSFLLKRISSKDNYFKFFIIKSFSLVNATLNQLSEGILLYEDFTVESGQNYIYYVQQLDKENNVYINTKSYMFNNYISVYFEDMFLYDGEVQLAIKFNPKIASFKINIQGVKIETIGNQFPYILYNNKTYYKEFPISGLISYNMDEQETFLKNLFPKNKKLRLETEHHNKYIYENNGVVKDTRFSVMKDNQGYKYKDFYDSQNSDLTDLSYAIEKEFKLAVLEFLNNKKPKLFRSSAEGNYCVMLLNSSLTPVDTLGRMIHSFNTTAYEVMDSDTFIQQLIKNTVLNKSYKNGIYNTIETNNDIKIITINEQNDNVNLLKDKEFIKNFKIENVSPMSIITLGKINLPDITNVTYFPITIGSTGYYNYSCFNEEEYISAIYLGDKNNNYEGKPNIGQLIIQDTILLDDSLFNINYKVQEHTLLGKEIKQAVVRRPFISQGLILPFYTESTNNNYGYAMRLDKIYNLKIRNFSTSNINRVSIRIGTTSNVLSEVQEISFRELQAGDYVLMSPTLKTYIDNHGPSDEYNLQQFFIYEREVNNYINRNTANEVEEYDNIPGSEFYIAYKLKLKDNITWDDFKVVALQAISEDLNKETKEYLLLPQEEKDIVVDLDLDTNDIIFNNIIITWENSKCTKDINNFYDIRCNIFAKITKIIFYEGQEVTESQ